MQKRQTAFVKFVNAIFIYDEIKFLQYMVYKIFKGKGFIDDHWYKDTYERFSYLLSIYHEMNFIFIFQCT